MLLKTEETLGESSCNFGDGTDQRVQSLIFYDDDYLQFLFPLPPHLALFLDSTLFIYNSTTPVFLFQHSTLQLSPSPQLLLVLSLNLTLSSLPALPRIQSYTRDVQNIRHSHTNTEREREREREMIRKQEYTVRKKEQRGDYLEVRGFKERDI